MKCLCSGNHTRPANPYKYAEHPANDDVRKNDGCAKDPEAVRVLAILDGRIFDLLLRNLF